MKLKVFLLLLAISLPGVLKVTSQVAFDIRKVPFSCFGSTLAFSAMDRVEKERYLLHLYDVSGDKIWQWNGLLKFELTDLKGDVIPCEYNSTNALLKISGNNALAEVCFEDQTTLRFRLNNAGLKITSAMGGKSDIVLPLSDSTLRVMSMPRFLLTARNCQLSFNDSLKMTIDPYTQGISFMPDSTGEFLNATSPIVILPSKNRSCEFVLESYQCEVKQRKYNKSFDQCVEIHNKTFLDWVKKLNYNGGFRNSAEKAAYINWASFISPSETMPRYGMLMSKNWMFCTWSWDHCFAALGLRDYQPKLGWDQFMLFFDRQDSLGGIPDYINGKSIFRSMTKPPVHGWALKLMLEGKYEANKSKLNEIYPKLVKWTNLWMVYRISKNGLPQYFEWYDSGLDNGSAFETGCPVESPDLAAYLVVQMDVLSDVAKTLNKTMEAKEWKEKADILLSNMLKHLYIEGKFVARRTSDGRWNVNSNSIISYLPLVLGDRLPKTIFDKLVNELKSGKGLLSLYGLMTENISSPYYSPDGYWRGPIWPSTSLLVIDGIRRGGDVELANTIAKSFCEMVDKQGFFENFNGETGKGLRDPAYNWTTGVFLHLINNYNF